MPSWPPSTPRPPPDAPQGPVSITEMKAMWGKQIKNYTMIRGGGREDWAAIKDIPDVVAQLAPGGVPGAAASTGADQNDVGEQKVGVAGAVAGDQVRVSLVAEPDAAAETVSELEAHNTVLAAQLAEAEVEVRTLRAELGQARKDSAGEENVPASERGFAAPDGDERKTEGVGPVSGESNVKGAATGDTINVLVEIMVSLCAELVLTLYTRVLIVTYYVLALLLNSAISTAIPLTHYLHSPSHPCHTPGRQTRHRRSRTPRS